MTGIVISPEVLSSLLGITDTEVFDLFTKDGNPLPPKEAGDILKSNVTAKITAVVESEKKKFDKKGIRDRGRKEALKEVNDYLIERGAKGENWKEQIDSLEVSGEKEITDSEVKNHPVFKNAISQIKGELATAKEELEAEKNNHQATINSQVEEQNKKAREAFVLKFLQDENNGYILPEDEERRKVAIRNLMRDIDEGDLSLIIDDNPRVVDSEGNIAQDAAFNDMTPEVHLSSIAGLYFPKPKSKLRNAPPSPSGSGGQTRFPQMDTAEDLQYHIDEYIKQGKTKSELEALRDHFDKNVRPNII